MELPPKKDSMELVEWHQGNRLYVSINGIGGRDVLPDMNMEVSVDWV